MSDTPRPTEEEQEQAPERIEEEESMRGPGDAEPDLPGDGGDDDA
jgi:hypothetical protein